MHAILWSWPAWDRAGWHVDVSWDWLTFGVVCCVSWGESFAIRLGFLACVVWRTEKKAVDADDSLL